MTTKRTITLTIEPSEIRKMIDKAFKGAKVVSTVVNYPVMLPTPNHNSGDTSQPALVMNIEVVETIS